MFYTTWLSRVIFMTVTDKWLHRKTPTCKTTSSTLMRSRNRISIKQLFFKECHVLWTFYIILLMRVIVIFIVAKMFCFVLFLILLFVLFSPSAWHSSECHRQRWQIVHLRWPNGQFLSLLRNNWEQGECLFCNHRIRVSHALKINTLKFLHAFLLALWSRGHFSG